MLTGLQFFFWGSSKFIRLSLSGVRHRIVLELTAYLNSSNTGFQQDAQTAVGKTLGNRLEVSIRARAHHLPETWREEKEKKEPEI